MDNIIYLDNNATTKIDSRVLEAMLPYLKEEYGNASSSHLFGRKVNNAVINARKQVADLIECSPSEITFTSGATESINLCIKGIAESYKNRGKHIITTLTEHSAVLDTCKYLETIGYDITYLPVDKDGIIDLSILKNSMRNDTILVTIIFGNNETGVLQSIKDIAEIAHSKNALFMTDATQCIGKIPVSVFDLDIDLMCFSAHKFYGPKGIGGLYIKANSSIKIKEQLHGGKQEKGLRSGTLNIPGIVGFGMASEIAGQEINNDIKNISLLRNYLEAEILKIEGTFINGNIEQRLYNVSNICFKNVEADSIIEGLKNIMVSNGSACNSAIVEPSHVLTSMGLNTNDAFSSIRFSLGRFNTKKEIDIVISDVKMLIDKLRATNKN